MRAKSNNSDAEWGGDPDERKSTSGYAFLLNDGVITWCSKKETCVTLSTMKAEYVACSVTVQESVWLRRFLRELGIIAHIEEPITIYCDSWATIAYFKDPKYPGIIKHIDIRYHFVRHMIAWEEVISTICMVDDPLTKPIAHHVYQAHVRSLRLRRLWFICFQLII